MRHRYLIGALAVAAVLIAAVTLSLPKPFTPRWVSDGQIAVRLDNVEITSRKLIGYTAPLPSWLARVPGADRLWRMTHGRYETDMDGLKYVRIEGTVRGANIQGTPDLEARIVCGDYTMGANGMGVSIDPRSPDITFLTTAQLGAHMPVRAIEIRVGAKWIRAWQAE